ncbi:MAG: phospholipid carrier-dependent glycosyltransferase, partial [Paludibacteraceae bacterium]|nr:phospholipid carrier-dependent glycosyltransferase [Paludibacteraceae bacterium]
MKQSNSLKYIVFPLLIVVAWFCLVLYTFNDKPDMNGDNFSYYIYATSLAQGEGYCDLSSPGSPATSNFPPGYPILMSPLRMITDSVVAQKWLNEVFVLGSILLLYFALLALSLPMSISFTAAFAGLFCPRLLHFSTMMMSEASFLFTSMLVFFALVKLCQDEHHQTSELRSPWFYVMLVALLFTYHIRTQGVALVVGVLFLFLLRKRWIALITTLGGFVLGCLPWMIRNKMLGLNGNRYLDTIMQVNPWRPEEGMLSLGEVVTRFFDTLRMLIFNAFPSTVL